MKRIALLGLLALAACQPTEFNTVDKIKRGGKLGNEYGVSSVALLSYAKDENGKKIRVSGATCSGGNRLVSFSGALTPALVTLPTYLQAERFPNNGKPPAIKGTCRYNGKTVSFVIEATSEVSNNRTTTTTYANGGSYNASTTTLTSRLSSTLPWYYPGADVHF